MRGRDSSYIEKNPFFSFIKKGAFIRKSKKYVALYIKKADNAIILTIILIYDNMFIYNTLFCLN